MTARICGYCGSKDYNCDCRERDVRVLPVAACVVAGIFWFASCAGTGRQLDAADPIAVARRAERVTPEMASEIIALCVPKPADPEAAAHCKRLGELFDHLVTGKETP